MPQIVLATINARYIHTSFGLRYIHANLGELKDLTVIREFDTQRRPIEIVEMLLLDAPRIIGLGVYIWNTQITTRVVELLKQLAPKIVIVLGGPEVSYEAEDQKIVSLADFVIQGEGDIAFRELCREILKDAPRPPKIIQSSLPNVEDLKLPYCLYTDQDIAHRLIYIEASRGCPFTCEFCLSALEIPVRQFGIESLLQALDELYIRGARVFKFVDRTFNLNINTAKRILNFFIERISLGLFLHFEMVPDRLPDALRDLLKKFPSGTLQLEIGIQSMNTEVCARISRRQDLSKLRTNITFLRQSTCAHLHVDLIAGLPGETLLEFGRSFDEVYSLNPHEIQVGILKRLRGAPIARHTEAFGMVYDSEAPYEVLKTSAVPFEEMQKLKRFARYWDIVVNSGRNTELLESIGSKHSSTFISYLEFFDWLFLRTGQTHSLAPVRVKQLIKEYLDLGIKEEREENECRTQKAQVAGERSLASTSHLKARQLRHSGELKTPE